MAHLQVLFYGKYTSILHIDNKFVKKSLQENHSLEMKNSISKLNKSVSKSKCTGIQNLDYIWLA